MKDKIYLSQAYRSYDIGPDSSSGFYVVVAKTSEEANEKIIAFLSSPHYYHSPNSKEMTAWKGLPLESRLDFVGKVLKQINQVDSIVR